VGIRSLWRSLRSSEGLRLIVAVAVAAGAVVLVESLTHGGHDKSDSTGTHSSQQLAAGGTAAGGSGRQSSAGGSGSEPGQVTVAGGPAVERALRHGSMTVAIDQPPPGLFAEQNRTISRGAEIAVAELNAAGGLPHHVHINLVRQSLDGLSATAVQARLRSDAAAVLVLPCDTNTQQSLAAAGSQFGMLMLAPCNQDATARERYATYWPVGMSTSDEAAAVAGIMGTLGYGSVFIVSAPGSSYVEQLTSDFRSAAQAKGFTLAGNASIPLTTRDFSGLASTIKAISPPPAVIFTALPPPLVNRLASGLRAQGVGQPVVASGTTMDTPLTLSSDPKGLENAIFASYGFPRSTASARSFAAAYRRRFHHEPVGSFPGLGLETIRLLENAVRKAGSAEPSAIQQALTGGLTLEGVGLAERSYQRGGDHDPIAEVAVSKIAAGNFLPLQARLLPSAANG